MPSRTIPILDRLRQGLAAGLAEETIEEAFRQSSDSWRRRILDPTFLLQILHGMTACQHVVHFGGWSFTDDTRARRGWSRGVRFGHGQRGVSRRP